MVGVGMCRWVGLSSTRSATVSSDGLSSHRSRIIGTNIRITGIKTSALKVADSCQKLSFVEILTVVVIYPDPFWNGWDDYCFEESIVHSVSNRPRMCRYLQQQFLILCFAAEWYVQDLYQYLTSTCLWWEGQFSGLPKQGLNLRFYESVHNGHLGKSWVHSFVCNQEMWFFVHLAVLFEWRSRLSTISWRLKSRWVPWSYFCGLKLLLLSTWWEQISR